MNRAAIVRESGEAVDLQTAETFEEALHILALQVRMAIGAHQSAVSYVPLGDFHAAVHTHSFSEKYAKYDSYDVMPTGGGIWALVVQQKLAVRMTQEELASHPMYKKFSDMRDQRGLEHPPMRGWLVAPVLRQTGEVLGVLQLSDKCDDADFTAEDLDRLIQLTRLVLPSFELQFVNQRLLEANKSVLAEITDRKVAEISLRASEERLRLALDAAHMGTFDWNIPHNRITWTRWHEELWGYAPGEFGGTYEAFSERVHPEDLPGINAEVARCIAARETFEREFRVVWPDGTIHWVLGRGEFSFHGSVQPLRMYGVVVEITERKLVEAALREKDRLLTESQRIAHIGGWSWDLVGQIKWTDETYHIYGVAKESFNPTIESLLDLIHPEDRPAMQAWIAACGTGAKPGDLDFRAIHPDGSVRILSGRGDLMLDAEGRPSFMTGTVQDITERNQAEGAIKRSETLLRQVTDTARVGLVMVNQEHRYIYANAAYAAVLDLPVSKIVGRCVPDLLPELYEEQIRPRLDRAFAGENVAYELWKPTQRGKRWYSVLYEPNHVGDSVSHVVVVVMDITERKRAEALHQEKADLASLNAAVALALSKSTKLQDMLRSCAEALVRNLGAAFARIWTLNRAAHVLELQASAGLYTHLDGPHGRVPVGKFKIGLIAHERQPHLTNDVLHDPRVSDPDWARREGIVAFAGYPLLVEDKLVGVVALFARQPLPDSVLTALASIADTIAVGIERKRAEVLLACVLDNVADGIVGIDESGMICSFNLGAERLFGYKEAEVLGNNVNMLMPEPYHSEHDQYIANYCRTGQGKIIGIGRQVVGRIRDGKSFPVHLSVSEFFVDGKRHFTGVVRDLTKEQQLKTQLQQSQKMEAIGSLAGGVAHDFNNLLTIINGYSEIILPQLPANSPLRDLVRNIGEAGERAASLTRQLLAFSRKQVLEPKILQLNTIVADLGKMLKRLVGEDMDIHTVLEPALGQVKADPGQVEQVVINLAVNARDAMPQGGKLTIETANVELNESYCQAHPDVRPGAYVMLAVSDTGCGMNEATKARIFEPFFTTKEVGKGTGLGLATVYGIIKQSEGHIAVYSESGHGATFKVYLPMVPESVSSDKSHPGLKLPLRGKETILLVEDEPALRALARHILELQGYTVVEASQGDKAIRIAEEYKGTIHLLVTDVVMPVMGGRKLAERLVMLQPDVKVLYLSGYTDDAVVRHGVLHADTAFLQKPFTPSALAQKVREVLDKVK